MAGEPLAAGADPRPQSLNLDLETSQAVDRALLRLDAWLDSMRQPGGYSGPVAHWWDDCLGYIGPGLDWRYEGIIIGYLNLWSASGDAVWLEKARRAADDLVAGQLPSGNYRNSCFELNPNTGGTPHEAACDLALLRLAAALEQLGDPDWEKYLETARRNLNAYYIGCLWDPRSHTFLEPHGSPSFVPNKSATLVEAFFAAAGLTGETSWLKRYAQPTLEAILAHQLAGGESQGAIYQSSLGGRKIARFFPFYNARCIPALVGAYRYFQEVRYLNAARAAVSFVLRCRYPDGSLPQVLYPNGCLNRFPQWVAGAGDVLRALWLVQDIGGVEFDARPTLDWLLAGRLENGALRTAVGFGRAVPGGAQDDPRDRLPVVGWCDKAFRCLSVLCSQELCSHHAGD